MKKMSFPKFAVFTRIGLISMICFIALHGFSQDKTLKNKWHYLIEPYVMFPNMNGTTGIGDLPTVDVNANPGEIFNRLQMGAMLYAEAGNDKWGISTDLLYMSLKDDVSAGLLIQSGRVTAKQLGWEFAGFYKTCRFFDAGLGLRINSINAGADLNIRTGVNEVTPKSKSITKTWVDPFIVARMHNDAAQKFLWQLRMDIGGFGIGSKLAWQIQAYAGYRFSKLFQLTGGYRIISMNYDKGSGTDRFMYDMNTFGPVIRFGFNF